MIDEHVKIYVLINPSTELPFYVGASLDPDKRYTTHLYDGLIGQSSFKAKQVREIRKKGLYPVLKVVHECPKHEATHWENYYVSHYEQAGIKLMQMKNTDYSSFISKIRNVGAKIEPTPIKFDPDFKAAIQAYSDKHELGNLSAVVKKATAKMIRYTPKNESDDKS